MGSYLYKKMYIHDNDWGASVGGVIGGQGATKTACCLDLAEKKMATNPQEKIFWHDTVGSPCQYLKLKQFPYALFIEKGLDLEFINITTMKPEHPEITYFSDVDELYQRCKPQTLNVVYFKSRKAWVGFKLKPSPTQGDQLGLLQYLMMGEESAFEWQTIFFDEMETIFPSGVNNQTDDHWWTWSENICPEYIKECRKSRVGLIGNYHNPNAIYHKIHQKFMFHIWGFGARVQETRIYQKKIDGCNGGEFWIDHQGGRFGMIKVRTKYDPPDNEWIARYK